MAGGLKRATVGLVAAPVLGVARALGSIVVGTVASPSPPPSKLFLPFFLSFFFSASILLSLSLPHVYSTPMSSQSALLTTTSHPPLHYFYYPVNDKATGLVAVGSGVGGAYVNMREGSAEAQAAKVPSSSSVPSCHDHSHGALEIHRDPHTHHVIIYQPGPREGRGYPRDHCVGGCAGAEGRNWTVGGEGDDAAGGLYTSLGFF